MRLVMIPVVNREVGDFLKAELIKNFRINEVPWVGKSHWKPFSNPELCLFIQTQQAIPLGRIVWDFLKDISLLSPLITFEFDSDIKNTLMPIGSITSFNMSGKTTVHNFSYGNSKRKPFSFGFSLKVRLQEIENEYNRELVIVNSIIQMWNEDKDKQLACLLARDTK